MNIRPQTAVEKAVIALLQPEMGRFSDQEIVVRALPIALWRERLKIAIQVYTIAAASEVPTSAHKNGTAE